MLSVFSYFAYILHFIIIIVVLFKVDCAIRVDWLMEKFIRSRAGGQVQGAGAGGGNRGQEAGGGTHVTGYGIVISVSPHNVFFKHLIFFFAFSKGLRWATCILEPRPHPYR